MKSLQDLIDSKPNLVEYFYNDTISPFYKSRTELFSRLNLIEREYTNWRDEQRAAHETCVLTNQSHHMPVLIVRGPDARKMLQHLTPISLAHVTQDRAKQYFSVTPRGYHIGDCLMYYHGEEKGYELISGMPVLNWVRYHGESGEYDVEVEFEPTTPFNPTGKRSKFRFQIEGPTAFDVLNDVVEGGWPELKFFHTKPVRIAGVEVLALSHSMGAGGKAGAELSGDYQHLDKVRDAIMKAGEKHGIRLGGLLLYFSHGLMGGWIAYPLPAIYTGDELRAYREWLSADSWEANAQIGGSLYSENIEDYYWTPSALGYDRLVKFDHDFIGREALETGMPAPRRVRRIFVWSREDVQKVMGSQLSGGDRYKALELPIPGYGWPQADEMRSKDGNLVGISQHIGYFTFGPDIISLGCVDREYAEPGTEIVLTWGEPNGGSRKPHVELHTQAKIRVRVIEPPYSPDKNFSTKA